MRYLLLLAVFSSLVFGYTIEFSKKFSKEISNDEITSYVSIYSKNDTQNKAINGLSKYKKLMEKFDEIKKTDIRQNSYPEYRYEKLSNKRILEGYKATLSYSISSEDAEKITEYIEDLLKIRRDEKYIQVTFSNLSYKVSKKQKELTEDDLRLDSILWANSYAKELSYKMKQQCSLKELIIGANNYARPMSRAYATVSKSASMEASADISLPTPSDTNISINSSFKFECK